MRRMSASRRRRSGYRYYRQEQLSDLVRIQWLSGYGFALHEIGPLLGLEVGALRVEVLVVVEHLDGPRLGEAPRRRLPPEVLEELVPAQGSL